MPPSPPPRIRYRLHVTPPGGTAREVTLDAEDVIAWVAGFAAALGHGDHLDVIDEHAPEDTRRVQALQIGDAQGWFRYLYPVYPKPTEG
jgi:hypothetical protein